LCSSFLCFGFFVWLLWFHCSSLLGSNFQMGHFYCQCCWLLQATWKALIPSAIRYEETSPENLYTSFYVWGSKVLEKHLVLLNVVGICSLHQVRMHHLTTSFCGKDDGLTKWSGVLHATAVTATGVVWSRYSQVITPVSLHPSLQLILWTAFLSFPFKRMNPWIVPVA
jgi:hypothetical protein